MKTERKWRIGAVVIAVSLVLTLVLCPASALAEESDTQEPEEGIIIINFDETTPEEAAEEYADLDGTDAHFLLQGGGQWDCYDFLENFSFQSLNLEMDYLGSYGSGDYRLADIDNLYSLRVPDRYNSTFSREDVFEDLTDLTLTYDSGSGSMFGYITARQMPSLKHLTLQFKGSEFFAGVMNDKRLYLFPETLETVDLFVDGQLLKPEEISPDVLDGDALASFLGILMRCCPAAAINGVPLSQLPALTEKTINMDLVRDGAAASYACGVYDKIRYGTGEGLTLSYPSPIYGKILFAEFDYYNQLKDLSSRHLDEDNGYRDNTVPKEMLAAGLEDADMLAIIYDNNISVGFYTYGGTAYQVDTMLVVADLNTGTIYEPYTVVSNDPPNTISVPTINGVPMGGSGYGDYEPQQAVDLVVSSYDSTVPGKADRPAEEPVQEEPVTEEETVPEPETDLDDSFLEDILTALDNPVYRDTLEALRTGDPVTQGTVSDTAGGLQQLLVDFGCDIAIDNSAGPGTFGALNQVLAAFGMENTETVDAGLFEELLPLLLLSKDEEEIYSDLLQSYFGYGENSSKYMYLKGCAYYASEHYYKALEAFEESNYGDYEDRMAACDQGFPQNGEIWHNGNIYGTDMYLTFAVNSHNEEEGMCFEVYTEDYTLASILFLKGSGSVTTKLPGGAYIIKDAAGLNWYGWKDAFGRAGSYEYMTFDEYEENEYLTWLGSGYEWTITVNVTENNPDASGVGAEYSDWDNWANH